MNTITVDFPMDDWVWLCEFLNEVIKLDDPTDPYDRSDLRRVINLLEAAEQGV